MSAFLQLINDPTIVASEDRPKNYNLTVLPAAQPSQDNSHLHSLIRLLREELARAEHALTSHKVLLQNAKVRETELRSELMV